MGAAATPPGSPARAPVGGQGKKQARRARPRSAPFAALFATLFATISGLSRGHPWFRAAASPPSRGGCGHSLLNRCCAGNSGRARLRRGKTASAAHSRAGGGKNMIRDGGRPWDIVAQAATDRPACQAHTIAERHAAPKRAFRLCIEARSAYGYAGTDAARVAAPRRARISPARPGRNARRARPKAAPRRSTPRDGGSARAGAASRRAAGGAPAPRPRCAGRRCR